MNRHRQRSRSGGLSRRYLWIALPLAVIAVLALVGGHQLGVGSSSADPERCTATAAQRGGWGSPSKLDSFDTEASLDNWWIYDGPGHADNGRRTPDAVAVSDGNLVITARPDGSSGGMAVRGGGSKFGRWEICSRSSVAAPTWHAVALLWPDTNDWPVGGEIDFMEIIDPLRRSVEYNLHYGAQDDIEHHRVEVDATRWHAWAVEWTPRRIAVYLDGELWAQSTDVSRFPPRSMHLCLQLDNFGGPTVPGGEMLVDWVTEYSV